MHVNSDFSRSVQWSLLYIIISLLLNFDSGYDQRFFQIQILNFIGIVISVYINIKFLLPLFFLEDEKFIYGISIFMILCFIVWIIHGDMFPWNYKDISTLNNQENSSFTTRLKYTRLSWIFRNLSPLFIIILGSSLFKLSEINKNKSKLGELNSNQSEIKKEKGKRKDFISVKSNQKIHRISLDSIFYIESLSEYIVFVLEKEKIISYGSLKETISKLPSSNFIRVHKSFIVSKKHVINLSGNQLDLGISKIPIGGTFKKEVTSDLFPDLIN